MMHFSKLMEMRMIVLAGTEGEISRVPFCCSSCIPLTHNNKPIIRTIATPSSDSQMYVFARLTVQVFGGNTLDWQAFWDAF